MNTTPTFPQGFLWGTASAAYQIEGAAAEDGRGPSIWDTFAHTGGTRNGDTGDIASDHYHRWEDDLDLLSELGVNSYRFSVSWSRLLPTGRGAVNSQGIDFYDRLVDGLLARGITPMVTLYHWDLPQALQDLGGWARRETADDFAEFVRIAHRALGDRVPYWLTLNEPYCSSFVGHLDGAHAPGIRDEGVALTALHHLLLAHGKGLQVLRDENVRGDVGITLNLTSVLPASDDGADLAAARRLDLHENRMFLDPILRGSYPELAYEHYAPVSDFSFVRDGDLELISRPIDYLGVNYYERHAVRANPDDPVRGWIRMPPADATIAGIAVAPEGLREVLTRVTRDYGRRPMIVTETGRAMHDYVTPELQVHDPERIEFFDGHIRAAADAIADGVDLIGFFPWSWMDSFEWQWGYDFRYGMYYVDYATQERIPKDSARWYRELLLDLGVPRNLDVPLERREKSA